MIRYKTKCGLNIIYIKKENFLRSYAGIGVKYGGSNLEFIYNDILYKSPEGLAHFIEHKLFQMPNGKDALNEFNHLNASANAYTTSDKTLYYFSTYEDLLEPLKLLLEMYFTPCFLKPDIEKEKEIIISEINMYNDRTTNRFNDKILKALYPNDPYSTLVVGSKESVSKTTVNDLNIAYNAFYTPQNSQMVIVSHYDEKELFKFIEQVLEQFEFKEEKLEILPSVKSLGPSESFIHEDNIKQEEVVIGLRFNSNFNSSIFCNYIIGIFDCLFTSSASFYKELQKKKAFISEIEYIVVSEKDSAYALISAPTNKKQLFIDMVINKLKTLQPSDLNTDILSDYLKYVKARYIILEDSVDVLGEEVLSLAIEGGDFFIERDEILKLKVESFYETINSINQSDIISAIWKKSKKKTNN